MIVCDHCEIVGLGFEVLFCRARSLWRAVFDAEFFCLVYASVAFASDRFWMPFPGCVCLAVDGFCLFVYIFIFQTASFVYVVADGLCIVFVENFI